MNTCWVKTGVALMKVNRLISCPQISGCDMFVTGVCVCVGWWWGVVEDERNPQRKTHFEV